MPDGVTSTAMRVDEGTSSRKSSNRFELSSALRKLMPERLPPGRARLATRPRLTGSSATMNTIGIVAVAFFSREYAIARRGNNCNPAADEVVGQFGQAIYLVLSKAVADPHILALDIARLLQALMKRAEGLCVAAWWRDVEEPDHRHRLLCPRHHRPRSSTAKPCDELASPCMSRKEHAEG
jgi:hypothetical protein